MLKILIVYASSHGHSAVIGARIAQELRSRGIEARLEEIRNLPRTFRVAPYDGVIVGSRIHGARLPRRLRKFIEDNRAALNRKPSAFYTVSLSMAGTDEEEKKEVRGISSLFLASAGWKPSLTADFAGELAYTRYGFILRFVMKRISAAHGSDTDTSRDYVYTDWEQVRRFAAHFADELSPSLHGRAGGEGPLNGAESTHSVQ